MSWYQIIAGGIITVIWVGFVGYVAVIVTLPNVIRRTPDRCTLIESDHDDRSTPETRARLSDGQ